MLETKKIQTARKAVAKLRLVKRRRVEPASEHPDLKMIRRHKATEAAIHDLERIKNSNRGFVIR